MVMLAVMLHLVIGPVGAGKSTFARELAKENSAVHLDLDAWMAVLFAADRPATDTMPWYLERTADASIRSGRSRPRPSPRARQWSSRSG